MDMSVIELPLVVEKWQADLLDKKFEAGRCIYNAMLRKKWNQLKEIQKTRAYREDNRFIYEAKKDAKKPDKETAQAIKDIYAKRNDLMKENGFTQFGFSSEVAKYAKPYVYHISSTVAVRSIAQPLWACFSSILYSKGERPHFKRYGEFNSLASDGKSGIKLLCENQAYYVLISNNRSSAKPLKMKIRTFTDYDLDMISRKIKVIRVLRKLEGQSYRYYCQLTVEGRPYIKSENDIPAVGEVGLAVWRTRLCAVSDSEVREFDLCPGNEEFEKCRDDLNRRMEEIRRLNNPDNFNEDGTIKKGIVVDGVKQKLKWYFPNSYKELRKKKRELERKNRVTLQIHRNKIVKELLCMGDSFVVADTSFLTQKPDPDEKLTNIEYAKKKERRKSIQSGAPSALFNRLNTRLATFDRPQVRKITLPESLYWYQHVEDRSDKNLLNGTIVDVGGVICGHTAYRAFLSKYYEPDKKCYNKGQIDKAWDNFGKMC